MSKKYKYHTDKYRNDVYFFYDLCLLWVKFTSEAATGDVLLKKVLLEISRNLHENTCARVSFFAGNLRFK